MARALIFDCDGVLADTERDGHRPAFNAMFQSMGLDVEWSDEEYHRLLSIGGGKERMATLFLPGVRERLGLPADEESQKKLLAAWHIDKTQKYKSKVETGAIPGRPGVARLVQEALANNWRLAVASTSAEVSVRAVLGQVVGAKIASEFQVFAGDVVSRKKPAPDIYLLALERLGVSPADAIVVEDSGVGLRAALAAGLRTIVTTSSYTVHDDFAGASLVVSSLGDLPAEPAEIIANPNNLEVSNEINLSHLNILLAN
jgi:HAD superfamily hydrolase (TIGR01509 family)